MNNRFAYHTSIIPVFTILLLLAIYTWVKGKHTFPFVCLLLGILYNFEIATAALWPSIFILVAYGLYRNKSWAKEIITKRVIAFSAILLLLTLIPMLVYDLTHGFVQTGKFILWIFYRAGASINYSSEHAFSISKVVTMFKFLGINYQKIIFINSSIVSTIIFVLGLLGIFHLYIRKHAISASYWIMLLFLFFPVLAIIVNQTPSDAYLPILFPIIIILTVVSISYLALSWKYCKLFYLILVFVAIYNTYSLFKNDFFVGSERLLGFTLGERLVMAKKIVKESNDKKYNLVGIGVGSQFESFTMNYEYLAWWLGNPPVKEEASLKFIIREDRRDIELTKVKNEYD